MRRAAAVLAGLAVALLAVLLWAAPARAHAVVLATDPANGAQLAAAPSAVRVTYDEAVTLPPGTVATALAADGTRVDTGPARLEADRKVLVVDLRPGLAKGVYIVSWNAVSVEGHPIGGSIQFGYGVPATAVPGPAATRTPGPGWVLAATVAKALVYLGVVPVALLLGVGPGERRRLWQAARAGAAAIAAGSLAELAVEPTHALAVGVRLALLAVALMTLPTVGRSAGGRSRRVILGLLGLAVVGSVVADGGDAWWLLPVTLLGVLVWRPRHAGFTTATVTVLVAVGLTSAVVQVRFPGALLSTTYGAVLLAELGLVAAMLVLARYRIALGAVAVVVAGLLSSVTPAAAAYAPQYHTVTAIGSYTVTVDIAPVRRGPQRLRVTVAGSSDAVPPARSLQLVLSQPAAGVRALEVPFTYRLPGAVHPGEATPVTFSGGSVNVPVAGPWRGTLTVAADPTQPFAGVFEFRVY